MKINMDLISTVYQQEAVQLSVTFYESWIKLLIIIVFYIIQSNFLCRFAFLYLNECLSIIHTQVYYARDQSQVILSPCLIPTCVENKGVNREFNFPFHSLQHLPIIYPRHNLDYINYT